MTQPERLKLSTLAWMLLMPRSPLTTLAFLLMMLAGTPALPDNSTENCRLITELSYFNSESRKFLNFLKDGSAEISAVRVKKWLNANQPVPLQLRLQAAGLDAYEDLTLKLVSHQEVLLKVLFYSGPGAAEHTARRMNTAQLLARFSKSIEPLPCLNGATAAVTSTSGGIKGSSANGTAAETREKEFPMSKETSISLVSILAAAGVILLIERITRARARRSYRYACSLPCILVVKGSRVPARFEDIGQLGAKIRLQGNAAAKDTAVTVEVAGKSLKAQIIWHTKEYAGLKFQTRLPPDEVAELIGTKLSESEVLNKERFSLFGDLRTQTKARTGNRRGPSSRPEPELAASAAPRKPGEPLDFDSLDTPDLQRMLRE